MALREEDVRNRSASSPSVPPAWVFTSGGPNSHQYEEGYPGSPSSDQPFMSPALLESIRPKSVPPEGEVHSTPPKPPPLPAPSSIKERRKFSRKYGSGVYQEATRDVSPAGASLESRTGYINGNPSSVLDGYGTRPLGFGSSAAPTMINSGYGLASQLPPVGPIPGDPYSAVPVSYGTSSSLPSSSQTAVERQEIAAKERQRKEERAKVIGKMIHGLDSTQINEVLSMIMTPDQVESLRFYSETAAKMRNKVEKKDWNKEFQKLLARPDDQLKFRKLYNLAHDFVYAASTYAKIIISELLLPESEKTIKPAALGGLAGGTKYVVQNIMFKFVLDFELKPGLWMYGSGDQRSDENAMKSASHELKGLMSYYSCNIRGLCFPLQALVDYKGFRVLAISILPINDETIIYGSSDAGKTVHSRLPEFNEKIDTAARILNLKPHYVNPTVQLSGPGDLEGHLGTDGKFYVLDAARTLPPEGPDENPEFREDRQVYYKLLRPEFVRKWNQPLCSDAFTSWQRYDPNRTDNNLEVLKATRYLHDKLIPKFAERLDKMASSGTTFADESKHDGTVSESFRLNRELFAKKWAVIQDRRLNENTADVNTTQISTAFVMGINPASASALRKSGPNGKSGLSGSGGANSAAGRRARGISLSLHSSLGSTVPGTTSPAAESKDVETSSKELDIILMNEEMHRIGLNLRHLGEVRAHVKSDAPRQRILIEMVARVIKDLLRAHLRHKMREVRVLSEEPFKEVVIKVFNFVLGRSPASSNFWTLVKSRLQRKYKAALAQNEKHEIDPMTLCSKMDMAVLFRRLEHLLGITLTESAREELESYPDSFEFVDSDVAEIYPKVKHMQIVDHAEGMALFLTAQRLNVGRRERLRQLRLSCEKFARALTTLPDSFTTLYQWGLALIEEAKMTAAFGAVRLYLRAADKFRSAVTINPAFQACFIKLGEAYIELARAAISAAQNGQALALPEIDDWEDSFREEISTEHKTPPKSAPKRYFIKATQALDRGLALPDFFFEEVYQNILHLHSDAVSARDSNRVRSRQLFYGSAILCEVVHNALNDHRLLLNSNLPNPQAQPPALASNPSTATASTTTGAFYKSDSLPAAARSDPHLTIPSNPTHQPLSAPASMGTLSAATASPGTPSFASVSSPNLFANSLSSGPHNVGTSISSSSSPSMPAFVFSSGISVAVPASVSTAGGSSSTPRIKDVISVITPALKTRLQNTPSQILTSPYATGLGDEFAAMKTSSSNLNLSSSNPHISTTTTNTSTAAPSMSASNPIPIHSSGGSSGSSTPLAGSFPSSPSSSLPTIPIASSAPIISSMTFVKPSLTVVQTAGGFTGSLSSPSSVSSQPPRAPVSVGYITAGVAVVKQTDSATSSPAQSPKTSGVFSHGPPAALSSTTSPTLFAAAEHISIPVSTWTPQDWTPSPNMRPLNLPPLSLPLPSHPESLHSDSDSDTSSVVDGSSECDSTTSSDQLQQHSKAKSGPAIPLLPLDTALAPNSGLVSSKSAGNLYHQGIVPHDAAESSLESHEPATPRKFRVALEAAPPTPYQQRSGPMKVPLDSMLMDRAASLSSSTEAANNLSPSTSLLVSQASSSVSPAGTSLRSVGIGLKTNKQAQELPSSQVVHPKPRRMRHSASVSSATSPALGGKPASAPFVQLLPAKPSPSPQPSGISTAGQYYSGVAEDEIQQLLNLSLKTGSQSSATSGTPGSMYKGDASMEERPTFAVIAEAKFKPFLARNDSPPLSASKRAEKGDEELYLKRILLDILAIWSDSLIQYASLKHAGDEMLFLAGAVKLRDVLALDSSYLEIIQTKIIPELKFQARDNRRVHYVLAALHGVIHEHDPTNTQLIYDMGASLHTYAQLHRLNPAKLELHQNEAAECFEEALSLDPSFADEMIHKALMVQGSSLEALLSIVEYSKAMHDRAQYLWDERLTSVSLAGCASVHDLTLAKLASLCPSLKRIDISRCTKITDRALVAISRALRDLKHLNLAECTGITDGGLQQFFLGQQEVGGPRLELLNLKGCLALTDAAVTQISLHCPTLTHLDLEHCKITNNAAATLAQYPLPRLTYLSFALCVKLEDSGIAEMVKIRRFSLTTIKLNGCNMLSDAGIETLVAGMPSLTELHIAALYRISNASVSQALAKLSGLTLLDVRNCKGLTWEVFTHLPFDSPLKMLYAARMDPSARPEDSETHQQRRFAKTRGMKSLCANAAPGLQVLDIGDSNMPEEPLYLLGHSLTHRLVKLDMSGCPLVTDELLSVYAPRVPHITHLNLNGCYQVTSRGISLLAQHCKDMRELFLSKISENREPSLLELVDSMPHLLKLDLSGNIHVTDNVLADIAAKLPHLDHLNITQCTKISDKGLRLITENLLQLVHLSMGGCLGITNESLACVAKYCRSLKELNISRCSITDPGLNSLAEGVTALRSVDLDNLSLITDVGLMHLVKHQDSLVDVSIKFCTKITAECKVALFKQFPALKLRVDPSGNSAFVKELAEASKGAHSMRTISSANIESAIRSSKQATASPSSPPLTSELQTKFERIKRPKSESVPPEPPRISVAVPYDDPAVVRFTLAQLTSKDPATSNCNPECLELYLDDEEFRQSFGMSKTEFSALIPWRKRQSKETLRLF